MNQSTIPQKGTNADLIFLISEGLVRANQLEHNRAPAKVIQREYDLIGQRIGSLSSLLSTQLISQKLEDELMRRITFSLATNSCVNCSSLAACPNVQCLMLVSPTGEPPSPYPYVKNANRCCAQFRPDWDQYFETGKLYPEIVKRLQTTFKFSLNGNRLARHLLSMMGKWAREVGPM